MACFTVTFFVTYIKHKVKSIIRYRNFSNKNIENLLASTPNFIVSLKCTDHLENSIRPFCTGKVISVEGSLICPKIRMVITFL
uniref:Uncharacterized protein n=1 Tax=Pyxicephalus adspersus TaxID=30357 RepID=A0AAV3A6Q1_PYXAD|nr:TPA: hypothetical protein GDO54_015802 [Pyxicephalus adspersus]